jgi:uroporphyrinogen-III decarboxylase
MPAFVHFETDTVEKMEAFRFDDPLDDRRYYSVGDDQINGVGDGCARNTTPFVERVAERYADFPVYGGVCEGHEMLWRIIGSENALMWMGQYPDEIARFVERISAFSLEIVRAQIKAAEGRLAGMVIWGDVAYHSGMLFSPKLWRRVFKPGVKAIVDECHAHGLPVIYHGCGHSTSIFEDFIEIGVDAYNPLESKAGMDMIELRRTFGHRIAFCGNMDVSIWAEGSRQEIERAALTRLNAGKGGGLIFQSDHSVPTNISGENYDYVVKLVRQYGTYPLQLGEFDIAL